ncbi:MAG: hypothetical protein ACAH59_02340 [Pseudobdellovibrionaceae bacterium]
MQKENKVEIIQLENGLKVPTFEGLYFCSRKNPLKEAESWILINEKILKEPGPLAILGLGAGFHLQLLKDRPETFVIELRPELIAAWTQFDSHFPIKLLSEPNEWQGKVIDFRPAWNGLESEYAELFENLRGLSRKALMRNAEAQDLWILAEALKRTDLPDALELTVKEITSLFPLENQTEEARIWRTLREFVA